MQIERKFFPTLNKTSIVGFVPLHLHDDNSRSNREAETNFMKDVMGFTPLHPSDSNSQSNRDKKSCILGDVTGFTLVELLVSMGVFAVVLTVVIAVFVSASRSQRLLTEFMSINNNVGFALEQMAREIRTGFEFVGGSSCANSLEFKILEEWDTKSKVSYGLDSNNAISRTGPEGGSGPLTASNVEISNLCFRVLQDDTNNKGAWKDSGGAEYNCNPWRVVISMTVEPRNPETKLKIDPVYVQTTVSSRVLPKEILGDLYGCRKTTK